MKSLCISNKYKYKYVRYRIQRFWFYSLDADELSAVDQKISSSTVAANEVIDKLDNFIRPLLENLAKDSDKDYIYWPNRVDIINKKILELDKIQAGL